MPARTKHDPAALPAVGVRVRRPAGRAGGRRPRGFSLLELLLALGLTMLVLLAVGMLVDFYLRGIESSRANVEEAQLARALLHRIADDLRGAVRYDPMNAEKLVPQIPGLPPPTNPGGEQSAVTGLPKSIPGLFGSRTELQIDVSRLPRADQYDDELLPLADSPLVDRLSDVKTVTYFVLDGGTPGQPEKRGLLRGELDRAVTAHAAEMGNLLDMAFDFQPIAPEVAAVEFEYFDGGQWLEAWDSIQQEGLPVAVRVTLYLLPSELRKASASAWQASPETALADQGLLSYSLVVRLPSSEPTNLASEWGEPEENPQ